MIVMDVPPEFYAMLGGLALAWSEYQHRREDAVMRERIAALELRVERLIERADEIDALLEADDDEPEPPPKSVKRVTRSRS